MHTGNDHQRSAAHPSDLRTRWFCLPGKSHAHTHKHARTHTHACSHNRASTHSTHMHTLHTYTQYTVHTHIHSSAHTHSAHMHTVHTHTHTHTYDHRFPPMRAPVPLQCTAASPQALVCQLCWLRVTPSPPIVLPVNTHYM